MRFRMYQYILSSDNVFRQMSRRAKVFGSLAVASLLGIAFVLPSANAVVSHNLGFSATFQGKSVWMGPYDFNRPDMSGPRFAWCI